MGAWHSLAETCGFVVLLQNSLVSLNSNYFLDWLGVWCGFGVSPPGSASCYSDFDWSASYWNSDLQYSRVDRTWYCKGLRVAGTRILIKVWLGFLMISVRKLSSHSFCTAGSSSWFFVVRQLCTEVITLRICRGYSVWMRLGFLWIMSIGGFLYIVVSLELVV